MPLVKRSHRPKRSLKRKATPRPLQTDIVRAYSTRKNTIRFVFTADVLKRLIALHMKLHLLSYLTMPYVDPRLRYRVFRLEFARLADLRIPGVLVRVEPPTYDPHGKRIHRVYKHRNQFFVEIVATKLKIRHPFPPRHLELLWADEGRPGELNGLILTFPDEDMLFEDRRDLPRKSSGVSPRAGDLAVH